MHIAGYRVETVAENPALAEPMDVLIGDVWPRYVIEGHWPDDGLYRNWTGIYERWPQYQFALFDTTADNALVASGNAFTLAWDGPADDLPDTGWDWLMDRAYADYNTGATPTIMSALSISIAASHRGRGVSHMAVQVMRQLAQNAGFARLIAPVRPSWKSRYPITPIADYMRWTTHEGLPFDPWLRTHARLGATLIKPCPRAMALEGSVAEWEGWTGMAFPASGDYTVPNLLVPLHVAREQDRGTYIEPNVWMVHDCRPTTNDQRPMTND